jgi:two-component sensor histidine kinase
MIRLIAVARSWHLFLRIGIVTAAVAAATALQLPVEIVVPGEPFLLNFIIVITASIFLGPTAGLVAAAETSIVSPLFLDPSHPSRIHQAVDLLAIVVFAIVAIASVQAFCRLAEGALSERMEASSARHEQKEAQERLTEVESMARSLAESEARVRLHMREANHRAKNMLSLVQAIARQTAARDRNDFIDRFAERLQALAATQDLLVRHKWQGIDMGDLVAAHLAHFADLVGPRIAVGGPNLHLHADACQALGLAIHELATNASKYGALSTRTGHVDINWRFDGENLAIDWVERDGPPVRQPEGQGFGTMVTGAMVKQTLGGEVQLDYAPSGLAWHLTCPAASALELERAKKGDPLGSRRCAARSKEDRVELRWWPRWRTSAGSHRVNLPRPARRSAPSPGMPAGCGGGNVVLLLLSQPANRAATIGAVLPGMMGSMVQGDTTRNSAKSRQPTGWL